MNKEQLMAKVQEHWAQCRRDYVSAIVAAAEAPSLDAFDRIFYLEDWMEKLDILRLKVEANVEETHDVP